MTRKIYKTLLAYLIFLFATLINLYSLTIYENLVPKENEYINIIQAYDWGAVSEGIIINTKQAFLPEALNIQDFSVTACKLRKGETDSKYSIKAGERKIVNVFSCDESGNPINKKSPYIYIAFEINPNAEFLNPFYNNFLLKENLENFYGLRIINSKLRIEITKLTGFVSKSAGQFKIGDFTGSTNTEFKYAYWTPSEKKEGAALVFWFHGIAEGGTNPYLPIMGTKLTNLITKEIQDNFPEGACILAPQCPTAWLETNAVDKLGIRVWEPVDINSKINKIKNPIKNFLNIISPDSIPEENNTEDITYASVSYYSLDMRQLLDYFLQENPYIDKNRIYIGGCSAGGYMALNMILQNPDLFAAGFLTCEAYLDSKLTNEQIEYLSKQALWFVHSKNDSTISPEKHDMATVERLKAMGAENIYFSLYEDVSDKTGTYFFEEELPFQFDSHASWIYTLNNHPKNKDDISLFKWLGQQSK